MIFSSRKVADILFVTPINDSNQMRSFAFVSFNPHPRPMLEFWELHIMQSRGRLRLNPRLRLHLRLTHGTDTMDTHMEVIMDILTDMDMGIMVWSPLLLVEWSEIFIQF